MATTTISIPTNTTNDATFRTQGSSISNAIATVGLVQTSDTGQINWTTVTRPAAVFTVAGFEIWRFNDSLQSTSPLFLKIEYGTSSATSFLHLAFTVSTGTDGAGGLTGNVSQRMQSYSAWNDVSTRTSYFSGANNRLAFSLWPISPMTGQWMVFGVERTHDSAGVDTGDGAYIFTSSYTNAGISQYLPLGATTINIPQATINTSATGIGWYCSAPLTGSGALGADFYTYPIKTFNMYETLPCFNFVHYINSDITALSTVSIVGYDGNTRTYFAPNIVNSTAGWFAMVGSSASTAVLMRYE